MLRFFLIEDDAVVRRMLERIINESGLGEVAGQADDGERVSCDQLYGVDVVLIDLLMPGMDGIQTIRKLQAGGFAGRYIMISQVENKEMIGEAYQQGIDTFIQKPINRLEVLSVLKRVANHISLAASLHSIRKSLQLLDGGLEQPKSAVSVSDGQINAPGGSGYSYSDYEHHALEQKVKQLMLQLGIAGEAGAPDLLMIMQWLRQEERGGELLYDLQLKELYAQTLQKLNSWNGAHTGSGSAGDEARSSPENGGRGVDAETWQSAVGPRDQACGQAELQREVRAMEQRIRRMVLQAFTHLSSLGLSDYGNPTFEHFAPRLFDFQEVRVRMQELEQEEKTTKCRINVRKFLSVFYMEIQAG
ncbi:response regulator [Paenibacillus puerhi]|uniref:response regulator n=1 Tax=Paenibacillus puerhi TaxID=2692622 RepID=UPI001F2BFD46|nr:response regulator [Paenibacillus puerhi]